MTARGLWALGNEGLQAPGGGCKWGLVFPPGQAADRLWAGPRRGTPANSLGRRGRIRSA